MSEAGEQVVIEHTRRWVEAVVIGLNLCPFARRVNDSGRIRYVVTDASDAGALLDALTVELRALVAAPRAEVETTILIHPRVLTDFADYNDFLPEADRLVRRCGLRSVIQIASFHPDYQFADTAADAVENYTNRSPYPMLHLLREESITEVAGDSDALAAIPQRNIDLLRKLGRAEMMARLRATTNPTG